jgi:site-specific DNA recombinase
MPRQSRPAAPAVPLAALYVRVSSARQAESKDRANAESTDDPKQETSLDTQLARCRAHAGAQGYVVDEAHVYREVYSGVQLWERPQLTRLREAVRNREVAAVVAYAIDRLARDPVHLGVVLSEAEHAGVAVEFVTEPLDYSPEGQLIRFVRGYAAKIEHEKIKERTWRGRLARVQAGKPIPGNRPPYGYQWADASKSALLLDDATAPVVRRIFGAVLRGETLRGIAVALTREGIPTPAGATVWQSGTVRWILKNEVYTGRFVALRTLWVKSRHGILVRTTRPAEEQYVLPIAVPPLVDAPTFEAVQARLARNKLCARRNNHNPEAALLRGGFVRCGECGYSMAASFHAADALYQYICSNQTNGRPCRPRPNIVAHRLDAMVWERVESVLKQPELVARKLEELRQSDPAAAPLENVERALKDLARRQEKTARALALLSDDPDAAAPVVAELKALAGQQRHLRAEQEALRSEQAGWHVAQQSTANLQHWCQQVATTLDTLDYAGRRLALEALGVEARVYGAGREPRIEIKLNLPLDAVVESSSPA